MPQILLPICPTDHSIRSESPNDNNASYSRLVYGNEDEQDSVSEYSGEESNNNINLNGTTGSRGSHGKPKVFSFAGIFFSFCYVWYFFMYIVREVSNQGCLWKTSTDVELVVMV